MLTISGAARSSCRTSLTRGSIPPIRSRKFLILGDRGIIPVAEGLRRGWRALRRHRPPLPPRPRPRSLARPPERRRRQTAPAPAPASPTAPTPAPASPTAPAPAPASPTAPAPPSTEPPCPAPAPLDEMNLADAFGCPFAESTVTVTAVSGDGFQAVTTAQSPVSVDVGGGARSAGHARPRVAARHHRDSHVRVSRGGRRHAPGGLSPARGERATQRLRAARSVATAIPL
jgi:hypothetical protein